MSERFDFEEFLITKHPGRYIQRLPEIGCGSARRVHALNERLVIKVAKTIPEAPQYRLFPGIAQNQVEAKVSADPMSESLVARVFIIGPGYRWIVSERCYKIGFDLGDDKEWNWDRWNELSSKHRLLEDGIDTGINLSGRAVFVDYGVTLDVARKFYGSEVLTGELWEK